MVSRVLSPLPGLGVEALGFPPLETVGYFRAPLTGLREGLKGLLERSQRGLMPALGNSSQLKPGVWPWDKSASSQFQLLT